MLYKVFNFYKRIKKLYLTCNRKSHFDVYRLFFFLPQTIFLPNTNKRSPNETERKKRF